MKNITLVKHNSAFAEEISNLTSDERIKNALSLSNHQVSLKGTLDYIERIQSDERLGSQYSRVIVNEEDKIIGIITLKSIDLDSKTAHIGTWIGAPYWGKGYNELAKEAILKVAFLEMDLSLVFAGAKMTNHRSIAAQKKLPYITMDVGEQYPEELAKIERETKENCILNVIEKEKFLNYLKEKVF